MKRRAERFALGAAVLLVHLLLLWAWPSRVGIDRRAAPLRDVAVVPITTVPMKPAARPEPTREPVAAVPARTSSMRSRTAPVPTEATPAADAITPPAEAVSVAQTQEPAASNPAPLDARLRLPRGDAERGGLALGRDSMVRQALNDPRSNVRTDPTQVLPDAVASARKGDCMKGEYLGGGMGLLSAPFLAVAVARGACKPQR